MTARERFGGLVSRVGALVAEKQRRLDEGHPRVAHVLTELRASRREPYDPRAIVLGRDERNDPIALPEGARLEHMHVIGATGSGKSTLLEHMARQSIALGQGALIVDPHGSLYRSMLLWLAEQGFDRTRTIHLIDPNATSHSVGFNPLDRGNAETAFSVVAEAMFEAFNRIWGDESGDEKPTIQRVLTATFTALGEQGLTLAETRLLFDPDDTHGIRALVLQKLEDSYAFDEIEWLHRIGLERTGRRDFRQEVIGPINRVGKLVRTEAVRAIVGQTENVIDLREAMDEGHIILANLSGGPRIYEQAGDLLGRLLTRFLFFHARRRKNTKRVFSVFLDEAQRYLSGDVPSILAEIRKQGVTICAAHQWLAQLGRRDDPIREAICKGPNIKVVFRIRDPREAAELAEAVMPLDLEMPVQALVKPAVVGHRRVLFGNRSVGEQRGSNWSSGRSETSSVSRTETESVSDTATVSTSDTVTESIAETEGESYAESYAETESEGVSIGESSTRSSDRSSSGGRSQSISQEPPGIGPVTVTSITSGTDEGWSSSKGTSSSTSRTESYGRAVTVGHTRGRNRSTTRGTSWGHTNGRSDAHTIGKSVGKTVGSSVGISHATGGSEGTSRTVGASEGIEPLYADLPTAVHGKENALHMAAQELLSLPTGTAYLSYVGCEGRVAARLRVPRVKSVEADQATFEAVRDRILTQSGSAIPMSEAKVVLERREARLIAEAKRMNEVEEPESFRVLSRPPKGEKP